MKGVETSCVPGYPIVSCFMRNGGGNPTKPRGMVLRFPPLQRTQGWASPNTQVWPPALCLKLLVLDAKASGTTAVAETVLANDSLSTLRDFASAWRDSAVSSRKRLNSA